MEERCKAIIEYISVDGKLDIGHLIQGKDESEIARQLKEITHEEQSEIVYQLFYSGKKYLRYNREEEGEGRNLYIFSVLTAQLADFDRVYFDGKFRIEGEEINLYDDMENRVIDVLYKPYYCEAVIEIGDYENEEKRRMIGEGMVDRWIPIREYDEPTNNSFPIEMHFSASPFRIKKMYAEWEKKQGKEDKKELESVLDKFEGKELDYFGQPDGKMIFESIFTDAIKSNVHVLRVGQASANFCFTKNSKTHKYYFDVGLPTDGNMLKGDGLKFLEEKIVKGYYERVEAEAVILSHWHSDHVKGAFTMKNIAATVWLAPVFKISRTQNPESINRLGSYIYSKKKLASVPIDQNPIYTCENFALYHGVGSKMNDKGLMLQLNSTLLPGDCQFDFWPQGYGNAAKPNSKYKNLVFPHHGAGMKDTYNRIDCLENSHDTKVIVPTGYNSRYGHPADNSNIFNGKSYTVFPTNPIDRKGTNASNSIFAAYFSLCTNARSDIVDRVSTSLTRTENRDFSISDF